MITTYDRVLNVIEKALQNFITEYWGIRKSLQNLVEGQEKNMAQLARIGAMVDQRQSLKEDLQSRDKESDKEDGDNKKRSEEGPKESQEEVEERTLLSTSCQNIVLFNLNIIISFVYNYE